MSQSANWTGSAFGTAFSYTHDVRGNRTQRGSSTVQNSGYALYTFDELNRMTKQVSAGNGATFYYRADGQRTMKIKSHTLSWNVTGQDSGFYDEDPFVNQPTTRYMHDGQMVIEEDYQSDILNDVPFEVTRYGLGARGIDYIEKFDGVETTTHAYPIYDGHGNMVSTVSKSGTGYAYGVTRVSDAWGQLAWGTSDGIQQRYCGSLGHQKDDETGGLVYMRARYYEPTTGRFLSEDPARDGLNWYRYASNTPTLFGDYTGKFAWVLGTTVWGAIVGGLTQGIALYFSGASWSEVFWGIFSGALGGAVTGALSTFAPAVAMAAGEFVDSFVNELCQGRINIRKSLLSAGVGGLMGGGSFNRCIHGHGSAPDQGTDR